MTTDPEGKSITRISNDFGPQDSAIDDEFDLPAAREQVVLRERVALLTEASVPLVGTTVEDARPICSDSDVSDCWSPSVGGLVPTVETTVNCARLDCSDFDVSDCIPEMLESRRDTRGSCLLLRMWFYRRCLRSWLQRRLLCRCPCLPLLGWCPRLYVLAGGGDCY